MGIFDRLFRRKERAIPGGSGSSFLHQRDHGVISYRNTKKILDVFDRNPAIRGAVETISFHVATTPWKAYRINKGAENARQISRRMAALSRQDFEERRRTLKGMMKAGQLKLIEEGHPMIDMLYRGDGEHIYGIHVMELLQQYMELTGEVFLEKKFVGRGRNRTGALIPIPPHWVEEVPMERNGGVYKIRRSDGEAEELPEDSVFWIKRPRPSQPWGRGWGTAQALSMEIDIDENASLTLASRLSSQSLPSALVALIGADNDAVRRYSREWAAMFQGPSKAGGVKFTGRDIKVQKLEDSVADLDLSNQLQGNSERIRTQGFRLPPEPMGITKDSNRATSESAGYIMAKYATVPRLCFWEGAINERMMPDLFGDASSVYITFESPIVEDRDRRVTIARDHPYAYSINDLRELAGDDPLESDYGKRFMVTNRGVLGTEEEIAELTKYRIEEASKKAEPAEDPSDDPDDPNNTNVGMGAVDDDDRFRPDRNRPSEEDDSGPS